MSHQRALALILSVVASTAIAGQDPRGPERFAQWAAGRQAEVKAFQAYLQHHGVGGTVPAWQLLRTASDWQRCGAEPFALPPEAQWPAAVKTLSLLERLREQHVLGDFEVVSAWRSEALNQCAQGSAHSAHVHSFAVDLRPGAPIAGLCAFWKQQGEAWQMGLSRYPSGRVHLDTAGYRTWGEDYTQRTSFCR